MTQSRMHLVLPALVLLISPTLRAQRVIYDGGRDKAAQDTVAAAKDLSSGGIFDKMLQNMDAQAKQEAQTAFDYARQQARAKLVNFKFWKSAKDQPAKHVEAAFIQGLCFSVHCELSTLKDHIEFELKPIFLSDAEMEARKAAIAAKQKELEAAIKALADASKSQDPVIVQAFTLINDNGKDLLEFADKIAGITVKNEGKSKRISNGLDEIQKGMDEMLGLYNAVKGIVDGFAAVSVDPSSLRPPQAQIELQLLAVDQDHLKNLAIIRARAEIDSAITLSRIDQAFTLMADAGVLVDENRVETTLSQAAALPDRDRLETLLTALHKAEAALAEEDVAAKLGTIRETDEARRYSIRRSAIKSSAYDSTILAAAQRLALYWKSGIKSSDVAALLFYLTNTVAVPVIAAK